MKNNDNKVAVFIKTCHGRSSLLWILESVKFALKDIQYRIYISDESPLDEWKIDLYNKLTENGHHIEVHNHGISCGVARNLLVDQLKDEDLVLRMDDDFELGGEFCLEAMMSVLKASNEIGFCSDYERQIGNNKGVKSGSIRPAGGMFKINPPILTKKFHSPFKRARKVDGYNYILAEHTRNLLLIKREVFDKVKWNEDLLFQGEHVDFMLSIKEEGFLGAYTSDSIHYHRDDLTLFRTTNDTGNNNVRRGKEEKERVLYNKIRCDKFETSYPLSWYAIELGRRAINRITN